MFTEGTANKPRAFSARRVALLSSVAALGVAILFAAPGTAPTSRFPVFSTYAQAAEAPQPTGFADIVERAKPAVISVKVKTSGNPDAASALEKRTAMVERKGVGSGNSPAANPNRNGPQSEDRNFAGPRSAPDSEDAAPDTPDTPRNTPRAPNDTQVSVGSGFFISADGYAVTNNHVVDHAVSIEITTDDGKTYSARVIGVDPVTDLALIKVDGRTDFPFVTLSEKNPRVGDWVVAIGNPFGLGGTVTAGIVSAAGRNINNGPFDDYIQIDAPINKGNSGGPTFDLSGNVIGVNTLIYSPTGGSVGIGFAIPASTVRLVVNQLMEKGVVTRGWLGVQVKPVTTDNAAKLGLQAPEGVLVSELPPTGPAARAGILAGDVITSVNGEKVKDSRDLVRRIGLTAPGTAVKIVVLRKGAEKTITVTLGTLPAARPASADQRDTVPRGPGAQSGA